MSHAHSDFHLKRARTKSAIQVTDWLEKKAKSCERSKDFDSACRFWNILLKHLTRTRGDVTQLAAIHFRLGLAHRALRDNLKSLYHLKYSIRLNSSEPKYYEAFGRAFFVGGHWRVAKVQFEKAVSLEPKNVAYIRQYAWILYMMGRKEEARSWILRALELKPTDRESQWSLVRIHMESGSYLQAVQLLLSMKKSGRGLGIRNLRKVGICLEECRDRLESTFEGAVLKAIRAFVPCNGAPFSILDLRRAEKIWVEFCISRKLAFENSKVAPEVWAAAVVYLILVFYHSEIDIDLDSWLVKFGVCSVEIWPCIKALQEFATFHRSNSSDLERNQGEAQEAGSVLGINACLR